MMQEILDQLAAEQNLRTLPEIRTEGKYIFCDGKKYLNLSSNDYLGITCDDLHKKFMQRAAADIQFLLSNPSSRLITGNSPDYVNLERALADLYGNGRTALVLGSGYLTNSGILPAVTQKGDLILADKQVHASIIDGLRLCEAAWQRFGHNDMEHLEKLLIKHRSEYRDVWIVTESVFSMDGDCAPLRKIAVLKQKYNLKIYVDEAHAFGVRGVNGKGLASETETENDCDIIVATLGKALASQGAFAIMDRITHDFLINRMRTLIFSTALPPVSLRWSAELVKRLPEMENKRQQLRELSRIVSGDTTHTHIIPLMAGENDRAIEMSKKIREAGFWVMPIRHPTVPKGSARVRVSLNAALTAEEIQKFAEVCKNIG